MPTSRRRRPPYARRRAVALGVLAVVVALVVVVAVGVHGWLRDRGVVGPLPGEERCVATVGDRSVVLDLDQAHYTAIVVGLSVRRGLAPRAGSIAMATVYQETGIRNLDYGDRDSVGLFQQRPSMGWGSKAKLLDTAHATRLFFGGAHNPNVGKTSGLLDVRGWSRMTVTQAAQAVQISAYPTAYAKWERSARIWLATL